MSIWRKINLILALLTLISMPLFIIGYAQDEDNYEENDILEEAWHLGYSCIRTWLSDISGLGVQADDDWYQIDVDTGATQVQVDCRFIHADGDIDIELWDSSDPPVRVAMSDSTTDNEFIDYENPTGSTYYIKVCSIFGSTGNTYDLRWDDLTEDAYEENDMLETAWHPGYKWERTYLATINGFGIQADEDWYRIDVDPGSDHVQIDCQFTHTDGDINIALYDSAGGFLTESSSETDDEFIDVTIPGGGTYYIKVFYWDPLISGTGNMYDLWWNDLSEDNYEENDILEEAWHPGYNWEGRRLSTIDGLGTQTDDDWYKIDVGLGSEQVQIDCIFTHTGGDIDIALYDSSGTLLVGSASVNDNEYIDYTVPNIGTYYILVYYSNTGNTYDLHWGKPSTTLLSGLGSYPSNGGWLETFSDDYSHADWLRVEWKSYNSANGEARIVTGDIDGDGRDEVIIGLGPESGGYFEVFDGDFSHLAWGRVNWKSYNSANGETWLACGDVDEDGRDEIIVGLGSGGGGYFEIFDYDAGSVTHRDWVRVNWKSYNSANGDTRPSCGDIDEDGRDEIVVGLGGGGGGYLEVFDDAVAGYAHVAWARVQWKSYNSANGETRPACGDIDGDGMDEIVVGLGSGGGGYQEVFDDAVAGYAHLAWSRVQWKSYNRANGETRPVCGDIDRDGRDEIVVGLGCSAEGYLEVFDDALVGYVHLDWARVQWPDYNNTNGETWPALKK